MTGLTCDEVSDALNATKPVTSIFDPIGNTESFTVENSVEDSSYSPDAQFDKIALWDAVKKLPPESQKLIILRYFKDMSQQKTAELLGITQVKVSRREKKIIEELRKSIV